MFLWCCPSPPELISTNPATGTGVAFVRLEADPDPVRVRAGWVTDTDIRDMAAACLADQPRAIEAVAETRQHHCALLPVRK